MKPLLRGLTLALLMLGAFVSGYVLRDMESVMAQSGSEFPLLVEAADYIDEFYVKDKPDGTRLQYALIRSYLAELGDPNTFFIEPAVAASESDSLAGRYGGIGVDIQINEEGNYLLFPFEDSPAQREGIREGDILLAVNGMPIELGITMDEVRQLLRGEIVEGAGVTLRVRTLGDEEEREIFVPFEEILVPSVTWRTLLEAPDIGYINISRFTSRTPEEFAQGVTELQDAGVKALVLDLRGNPGGLLQESIDVAGEFFDGGVLSIEERVTGESTKDDEAGGMVLDLPVVVLVDHRTASASEIVAGALQARERGIVIGQQTFGKGSIQSIFSLSDSSSIHVTVAVWYKPDGGELDGVGLTPDIPMIPDENQRDVELGEAIRYLQSEVIGQE